MTKLHRLYKRRLAQTNKPQFDAPGAEQVYQDQLEEEWGLPVPNGVPAEVGNQPIPALDISDDTWEQNFGVHNDYVAKYEVDGQLWLLSNDPWNGYYLSTANIEQDSVDNPEEYEEFDGLAYIVQPMYQAVQLDDGMLEVMHSRLAEDMISHKIIENLPADESIATIIHNTESSDPELFRMPNVLVASRIADVNIVDEIEQPESLELSETSTFPAGEQSQSQSLFHPTKQLQLPKSVTRGKQSVSMREIAAEFGFGLNDLAAPSIGDIGTDNPADNHQSENDYEDPDIKLGEVEEPYSSSSGPMNVRFDDDKKYDMVKGAQKDLVRTPEEQVRSDEEESNWGNPVPGAVPRDVSDLASEMAPLHEVNIAPSADPELDSDAYLYVTGTIGIRHDDIVEAIHSQIEKLMDSGTKRTSFSVYNLRAGPNVFSYTIVTELSGSGWYTVSGVLNGTARVDGDVTAFMEADDHDIDVWDVSLSIWEDLLRAVDANLYWLDPTSYTIEMPKEAVGLIEGPAINENSYGNDFGRADSAIPRPHDTEKLVYR